jgi:hypothetical protein
METTNINGFTRKQFFTIVFAGAFLFALALVSLVKPANGEKATQFAQLCPLDTDSECLEWLNTEADEIRSEIADFEAEIAEREVYIETLGSEYNRIAGAFQ